MMTYDTRSNALHAPRIACTMHITSDLPTLPPCTIHRHPPHPSPASQQCYFLAPRFSAPQCVQTFSRWAVPTVVPLQTFVSGRVVLLGDAVSLLSIFTRYPCIPPVEVAWCG